MTREWWLLAVVSLSVLAGVGCAGAPPRPSAPSKEIVLQRPIEQVWPQAEQLLRDKGWMVEFREGYVMATSWRQDTEAQLVPGGTGETLVERMVITGKPLAYGQSTVRIVHQQRTLRVLDIGGGGAANVLHASNRDYQAGEGKLWHQESHQVTGPELPMFAERDVELERELAQRLASSAPSAAPARP